VQRQQRSAIQQESIHLQTLLHGMQQQWSLLGAAAAQDCAGAQCVVAQQLTHLSTSAQMLPQACSVGHAAAAAVLASAASSTYCHAAQGQAQQQLLQLCKSSVFMQGWPQGQSVLAWKQLQMMQPMHLQRRSPAAAALCSRLRVAGDQTVAEQLQPVLLAALQQSQQQQWRRRQSWADRSSGQSPLTEQSPAHPAMQ
jgi:hypothetical protein